MHAWSGVLHPTAVRPPKSIAIRCAFCQYVHKLERKFTELTEILLVCHGCEMPLVADLTAEQFVRTPR